MRRSFFLIVILALAAVASTSGTSPVHAAGCAGNLLQNPTFDGGSRKTEAEGTSLSSAVSSGWSPWFVRGNENVNREPEFKVEQVAIGGDPNRVRSGGQAMKWFTTWATHDAGIYQRVRTTPGTRLRFTIHALVYTGEADGWSDAAGTFLSDPAQPGNYRVWAGIDPTGAIPGGVGAPPPASVVWSPASLQTDSWTPLTVETVAQSSTVTVFARGAPEWGVKHNDSFWEDACLVATGRGPAQPAVEDPGASVGSARSNDGGTVSGSSVRTSGTTVTSGSVSPADAPPAVRSPRIPGKSGRYIPR